jgi:hypothetical protein
VRDRSGMLCRSWHPEVDRRASAPLEVNR